VHAAKVFTNGISGLSHWGFGNVDRKLLISLSLPGVFGGFIGAYVLTAAPGQWVKPVVAVYLIVMGFLILHKAFIKAEEQKITRRHIIPLALTGGFLDSIGGGGWGPIVTGSLVAKGKNPRITIGSVNMSEFFVALAQTAAFFLFIGFSHWKLMAGLILGGAIAAPFAAWICKRLPTRALLILVGILIILLSLRTIYLTFTS
jgi:uncharacterized membrane protein YfcA